MKRNIVIAAVLIAIILNGVYFAQRALSSRPTSTASDIQVVTGSGNTRPESLIQSGGKSEYRSLSISYRREWENFRIENYITNGLYVDLFHECSEYVAMRNAEKFDTGAFLNIAIGKKKSERENIDISIDFSKKPDCKSDKSDPYCAFLASYPPTGTVTLAEASFGLMAMNFWDLSYSRFREMFRDPTRVRFPNMIPDLEYAEYYAYIVSGKITDMEGCLKFVSKKQNDLVH